jgi:hypothetical protein
MENPTDSLQEAPKFELDNAALIHLAETRKWTMFLSVLGFIVIGLMLIVSFCVVAISSFYSKTRMDGSALAIIPLLLLCLVYLFPIIYLFKFSSYSGQALINNDNGMMSKALGYLKRHYRFMGILVIIMTGIYIIVILIMLVAGSLFKLVNSI